MCSFYFKLRFSVIEKVILFREGCILFLKRGKGEFEVGMIYIIFLFVLFVDCYDLF